MAIELPRDEKVLMCRTPASFAIITVVLSGAFVAGLLTSYLTVGPTGPDLRSEMERLQLENTQLSAP
jgi:hypothetical protein